MKNIDQIREKIRSAIVTRLSAIKEICSITFVGSFLNNSDILSVSDIDIIVIVNNLTEPVFANIENEGSSIKGVDCGLPDYRVKLNMSFGPLKFNDSKTIVFHVMVYDRKGHRKHVIESPFTCCDWEFHQSDHGLSLSEIYPSFPLQLNDILGSRRSLESYLSDLQKGVITYRKYQFSDDSVTEVRNTYPMDGRHKKEYAYHIIKFLMLNLLKILTQKNRKYTDKELAGAFLDLGGDFNDHIVFFLALSKWKYDGQDEPADIFQRLAYFITDLGNWLHRLESTLPKVSFIRHAKTDLNDGSFLGVRRNPGILTVPDEKIPAGHFDCLYTGTLDRTISTGSLLNTLATERDDLLNEIDYGLAEGLSISDLQTRFPEILDAWEKKEDPRFPEGENQQDVADRLNRFVVERLMVSNDKRIAVVTHNVVIRALLAVFYQQPVYNWYRFMPEHLEQIPFRIFKGVLIPELSEEQRVKFRDQAIQWK